MTIPNDDQTRLLSELNDRSREVFRRVVEGYLETGDPVGSRSLTRTMSEKLSAATIRNVMQDLEYLGLLDSPHVSAGRIPTQMGLRLFVDGVMEVNHLGDEDRAAANQASEQSWRHIEAEMHAEFSAMRQEMLGLREEIIGLRRSLGEMSAKDTIR